MGRKRRPKNTAGKSSNGNGQKEPNVSDLKKVKRNSVPSVIPGHDMNYFDYQLYFALIFFVRLLSVFVASNEFVPDEGWQSVEVSRWFVYGSKSGFLTWEWVYGLRSFIYPILFVPFTCILRGMESVSPTLPVILPRILHALLTATGECSLLRYSYRHYGGKSAKWIAHLLMLNWFMFFCASRNLTNNVEMALGLIALDLLDRGDSISYFTAFVGISFCIRPTSIVFWVPMTNTIFKQIVKDLKTFQVVVFVGLSILFLNTYLDYCFYKTVTFTWWNFLKFNIIDGKSAEFGTHPYLWYIYSAFPSMLGIHFFWVLSETILRTPRHMDLIKIIVFYVAIFSVIGHKEIRFMMPVLPLCCVIAGDSWYHIMKELKGSSPYFRQWLKIVLTLSVVLNFLMVSLFCGLHQVGIKPATRFINEQSQGYNHPRIWVLMPCFSFPVHTYINQPDAILEYLTCSPPGFELNATNPQIGDFADIDLTAFVCDKAKNPKHRPDFVMVYDHTSEVVLTALNSCIMKYEYRKCHESFHTIFPFDNVGGSVQVICQI